MIDLINLALSTKGAKGSLLNEKECCNGQFDMSPWLNYRYPTIQSNRNAGVNLNFRCCSESIPRCD